MSLCEYSAFEWNFIASSRDFDRRKNEIGFRGNSSILLNDKTWKIGNRFDLSFKSWEGVYPLVKFLREWEQKKVFPFYENPLLSS
jgi:hypothetical protein